MGVCKDERVLSIMQQNAFCPYYSSGNTRISILQNADKKSRFGRKRSKQGVITTDVLNYEIDLLKSYNIYF